MDGVESSSCLSWPLELFFSLLDIFVFRIASMIAVLQGSGRVELARKTDSKIAHQSMNIRCSGI